MTPARGVTREWGLLTSGEDVGELERRTEAELPDGADVGTEIASVQDVDARGDFDPLPAVPERGMASKENLA